MKLGIGLPNCGSDVDPAELVRLAIGAEQIGLDSVWVADRWLRPHAPVSVPGVPVPVEMPVEAYSCVYDPIDLLTFIAARTERVQLGTSAINALYHPPVLLARRLATLDQLSGGRVIAGVTSGWMAEEFSVAGVPKNRMGHGFDDHLAAMRTVWGPDPVSYHGSHYIIPTADIGPKPRQSGGIPFIVGYTSEAGIRRAARIGEGLHPYRNDYVQLVAEIDLWRDAVAREGRDAATMPVVLRAAADIVEHGSSSGDERPLFTGDVSRLAADLARVEALGIDHVFLQFRADVNADAVLDTISALTSKQVTVSQRPRPA